MIQNILSKLYIVLVLVLACSFSGCKSDDEQTDEITPDDSVTLYGDDAFPGCQGWGCSTEGGRNGQLLIVTSTADNGPGTLREALESTGSRYIITQVDGIVNLNSEIKVTSGNVTLDLRRPPGCGLTIAHKAIIFQNINDVVVLGIRYRGTDKLPVHGQNAATVDCIGFTSVQNAVVAHSSFFGWVDEAVSIERAAADAQINKNITVQNNLFLEGCMIDCQGGGEHARPINVSRGWDKVAVHHNAFFGNERRQPQMAGCVGHPDCEGTDWPLNPTGYIGYNLIANWKEQATHIKNGAFVDIIGNHYVPGLEARSEAINIDDDTDFGTTIYLSNNVECITPSSACSSASVATNTGIVSNTRLTELEVSNTSDLDITSPEYIRSLISLPLDEEDERVIDQYVNQTIVIGGNYDPNTYLPPTPCTGSITDSDKDGIPDEFDPLPNEFSAWNDTNEDNLSDLEAYLAGIPLK